MQTPFLSHANAERMATEDAKWIIESARATHVHEPCVWLTGNAFVPAIRSFENAEKLWQQNEIAYKGMTAFEVYCETIENLLDEADVYMTSPEWDNALYCVDLARFQSVEDPSGDSINDEWELIEDSVCAGTGDHPSGTDCDECGGPEADQR